MNASAKKSLFKKLTRVTRAEYPFLLRCTIRNGEMHEDSRVSLAWLQRSVDNYASNAYFDPKGPLTVYLWAEDAHLFSTLNLHGYPVTLAAMEDYAKDYAERAATFLDGYESLIARTGFYVGVDCHNMTPALYEDLERDGSDWGGLDADI
jgi:hypothetical protein